MPGIKLLYCSYDGSKFVARNHEAFRREVAKKAEVLFVRSQCDIRKVLKRARFKPDFIVLDSSPELRRLDEVDIPKALILDDVHWMIEENKKLITYNNIDIILSRTDQTFHKYYPEFHDKFVWLPYGVDSNTFKDYRLPKSIDFLLMGAAWPQFYPYRAKVLERFSGVEGFVYHPHPGYRNVDDEEQGVYVGEKYAREINRAKIFFTCDSIYHYPIAKYLEVLASNTLLLAPSNSDIEKLGLIPGKHFIECGIDDFFNKAMYYRDNAGARRAVAYNGYRLVHTKHGNRLRASQLIKHLKGFGRKSNVRTDVKTVHPEA